MKFGNYSRGKKRKNISTFKRIEKRHSFAFFLFERGRGGGRGVELIAMDVATPPDVSISADPNSIMAA